MPTNHTVKVKFHYSDFLEANCLELSVASSRTAQHMDEMSRPVKMVLPRVELVSSRSVCSKQWNMTKHTT